MTEWYDFPNIKSSKMLSFDSVAEAHGLIYPRSSSENFSFALTFMENTFAFISTERTNVYTFCPPDSVITGFLIGVVI